MDADRFRQNHHHGSDGIHRPGIDLQQHQLDLHRRFRQHHHHRRHGKCRSHCSNRGCFLSKSCDRHYRQPPVLGADSDGGESNLIYTWSTVGPIPGNLAFRANGTNAAKSSTVTFSKVGIYNFKVTINDSGGLSVTSSVTVTVNQTLTNIAVSPTTATISPLGTHQFTAIAMDQFGNAMASQPSFTWSVSGGSGSINSTTGLYTAPGTGTSAAIRAASGVNGSAAVTVTTSRPLGSQLISQCLAESGYRLND